jgi:hypothetical protein
MCLIFFEKLIKLIKLYIVFQPSVYSETNNGTLVFFDQSQRTSGLIVGVLGLVSASILSTTTASCSTENLWPILTWQAMAACATSMTGIF